MRAVIASACLAVIFASGMMAPSVSLASDVDHALWDRLLKQHVQDGRVDYQGFQRDHQMLRQYLALIRTADVAQLGSHEAQLAFWINAYNACTIEGVLANYPIHSVQDEHGFFTGRRYAVAGEQLTLNDIEERGRALGDWRIHFAVVCASSSCPTLRSEAYTADQLENQLNVQTRMFLASPERGLRLEGDTLWVSKIFKWYTGDFLPEARFLNRVPADELLGVLKPHLNLDLPSPMRQRALHTQFLEYNWTLNDHTHN